MIFVCDKVRSMPSVHTPMQKYPGAGEKTMSLKGTKGKGLHIVRLQIDCSIFLFKTTIYKIDTWVWKQTWTIRLEPFLLMCVCVWLDFLNEKRERGHGDAVATFLCWVWFFSLWVLRFFPQSRDGLLGEFRFSGNCILLVGLHAYLSNLCHP